MVAAFLAILRPAAAGEVAWTEDAKAALAEAAKEKKDVLINFTGSDWCGWCKKLNAEVFSQDAFVAGAPKSFVFLKLDFPRSKPQTDELKKQNAEWRTKLGVTGYPTIILADAEGRPYAKTGYQPGGAEKYMESLGELRKAREKRDAALAKAEAAEGVEKAKLLDEALSALDSSLVMPSYSDVVDQILKLDPENKAGLKAKYEAVALMNKVRTAMRRGKADEALALADEGLKAMGDTGQAAQDLLFAKSEILYRKKDMPGAKATLEAALKAAPDSDKAPQIKSILARVFKDTP